MVVILDTSAILSGKYVSGPTLTTPAVIDEFKKGGHSWRLLQYAQSAGMRVRQPAQVFRTKVATAAKKTGDLQQLSNTDIEVLALALELGHDQGDVVLLSDDYAIQNVAAALDISVQGVVQPGIRQHWHWNFCCSSCGRTFEHFSQECSVCGGPLRRVRAR